MYISSRLKAVILAFLLAVGGGGAFVYVDPLELHLLDSLEIDLLGMLGLNPEAEIPAVVAKTQPRTVLPKGVAPAMAPASTTTTAQTSAKTPDVILQTAPSVSVSQVTTLAPLELPSQSQPAVPPSDLTAAINPASPEVTMGLQTAQPPLKISKSLKAEKSKFVYPPSVDLRHCLDQPSPQEIAKCAGE